MACALLSCLLWWQGALGGFCLGKGALSLKSGVFITPFGVVLSPKTEVLSSQIVGVVGNEPLAAGGGVYPPIFLGGFSMPRPPGPGIGVLRKLC